MMRLWKIFAFPTVLIKQPTYFKNPKNPSYIDLILTNKSRCFRSTCVKGTGLYEIRKLTVSVLKLHFSQTTTKFINCRDFKKFQNERFMDSLHLALNSQNVNYINTLNICHNELNYHAPRKKNTPVGIMYLSWLKRCLSLSWKERVLETNIWKIR